MREVTASERATLDYADKVLTARCMRARGFPYDVPPPGPQIEQRDFPYVLDDPAWAKKHGYGSDIEESVKQARNRDPVALYFRGLSPDRQAAARQALNGDSPVGVSAEIPGLGRFTTNPDSCVSRADRELYGDLGTWFRVEIISKNLRALYGPRVAADPRYKTAVRAWSGCMSRRGMPAADPQALSTALDRRKGALADVQARRRLDIEYATAEAECAVNTPLAATARRLDREFRTITRRRFSNEMQTLNRLQVQALPIAEKII